MKKLILITASILSFAFISESLQSRPHVRFSSAYDTIYDNDCHFDDYYEEFISEPCYRETIYIRPCCTEIHRRPIYRERIVRRSSPCHVVRSNTYASVRTGDIVSGIVGGVVGGLLSAALN